MSTIISIIFIYLIQSHLAHYPFVKSLQRNCSADWLEDLLFKTQMLANKFTKVPIGIACALFVIALFACVLLVGLLLYYSSGEFGLGLCLFDVIILFYCFAVGEKKQYSSTFVAYFESKFGVLFWFLLLGPAGAILYLLCSTYGTQQKIIKMDNSDEYTTYTTPIAQNTRTCSLTGDPADDNEALKSSSAHSNNSNNNGNNKVDASKQSIDQLCYAKNINNCLFSLHIIMAWLPARITSLIFILVGNFEKSFNCWKNMIYDITMPHTEVLELCGKSSLENNTNEQRSLMLLERSFVVWIIFSILIIKLIF
jgi:membrane protein required for beta-lactamase induction